MRVNSGVYICFVINITHSASLVFVSLFEILLFSVHTINVKAAKSGTGLDNLSVNIYIYIYIYIYFICLFIYLKVQFVI